jgi:hypothetical protein
MDCGGVPLCGVLTLETGLGEGHYAHSEPVVHGLWPETGSRGTSQCQVPRSKEGPSQILSCYRQGGYSEHELLRFQKHEWTTHGMCSGAISATDYFDQVCSLAAEPLAVMVDARRRGASSASLRSVADDLRQAGYPVHRLHEQTREIHLSACAGRDGRWKLAAITDFGTRCGGPGGERSDGQAGPLAEQNVVKSVPLQPGQCLSNQRGPECSDDSDCSGLQGCVRCAHSGYCTHVSLE